MVSGYICLSIIIPTFLLGSLCIIMSIVLEHESSNATYVVEEKSKRPQYVVTDYEDDNNDKESATVILESYDENEEKDSTKDSLTEDDWDWDSLVLGEDIE